MAAEAIDELAARRTLQAQHDNLKVEVDRLKSGGGGGTSDGMVSLKEYVDKADEAVETRLNAKLDKLSTKESTSRTVWGAAATVLGILLAVAAFAGDRFDSGFGVRSAFDSVLADQRKRDETQDRKLDEILKRLPPPEQAKR